MELTTLKLIQLIITTIIGGIALILGFVLFTKGISGNSTIMVQRKDTKGKITNAAPGIFLFIVGALIIYWSINRDVTQEIKTSKTEEGAIENWFSNVEKVDSSTNYSDMLNIIMPSGGGVNENFILTKDMSLGEISDSLFKNSKYWKLLAVFNKDRGYYVYSKVSEKTIIKKTSLLEYFYPKKFSETSSSIVKVGGHDRNDIYDAIMMYSDTSKQIHDVKKMREFEQQIKHEFEVSIGYQYQEVSEETTINELALKYYQDKKYSPIIINFNKEVLRKLKPTDIIPKKVGLLEIPYVIAKY